MHKPEMVPVNHLSRQLALAIGWKEEDFVPGTAHADSVRIRREDGKICSFSVNDYTTMWKIAEKYNCFPIEFGDKEGWIVNKFVSPEHGYDAFVHKDPLKAVALAVIG